MIWLLLKIVSSLIFIFIVHQYFLKPNGFIQFYKKQGIRNCSLKKLSNSDSNSFKKKIIEGELPSGEKIFVNNTGTQVKVTINCPIMRAQFFESIEEYDLCREFKNTYFFLLGNENLLFKNGKKWEDERLTFSSCFRSLTVKDNYLSIKSKISESIARDADKGSREATAFCRSLAGHVFFELFFGSLPKEFTNEPENLINILNRIHEIEESLWFRLFGRRYFVFSSSSRHFLNEITLFREYLMKLVESKAFESLGEGEGTEKPLETILQKAIANSDFQANKELYTEELLNNFLVFCVFAIEVLGTQTANILALLQENFQEKQSLLNEISNLNLESQEGDEYDKIIKLPYLDKIIKESLRLKGSFPFSFPRIALQNHRLGSPEAGIDIAKDTIVETSLSAGHLEERIFTEPKIFNPKRWDAFEKLPESFLPFGSGPRKCIAKTFSINLLKTLVFWLLKGESAEISLGAQEKAGNWRIRTGFLQNIKVSLKLRKI